MRARGFIRLVIFASMILGAILFARAGGGTAFAQSAEGRGLEAFSQAARAYDEGDLNKASGLLDEAFQAGLSNDLNARAILLRAMIYERNGALARALQDYSNALWIGNLPAAEQKMAAEGKQRVIAAMGLGAPEERSRQASAASPAPQAAPQSSSGVFGMFGGIFGSSEPAAPPAQQAAPAPAPQPAQAEAPAPVKRAAKVAEVKPAKAPAPKKAVREKPPAPVKTASIQPVAMAPAASASGFLIVFGSAPSEAAGQTKAHQIKAAVSDILVSRQLDVAASRQGGFLITAGPYKAKGAALALCSAMKQRGVGCSVTP